MDGTGRLVLDASALLAFLLREPGNQMVQEALASGADINTVNYAEVLSRIADTGVEPATAHRRLQEEGLVGDLLHVVPLIEADAVIIARLRATTRAHGLSLGDRACLATASRLGRPVLTADRSWAALDIGVAIHLIRQ